MVPAPIRLTAPHSSHLLITLTTVLTQHVPHILRTLFFPSTSTNPSPKQTLLSLALSKRADDCQPKNKEPHDTKFIVFATLIPILVLLSGVFAGLTLGYMSLDETQLKVLSISGTATQRLYANKIRPIRKNGHLLLVTLLLANMIVNETLPVIADPVLGGGAQSVVVSTVLIVIFAEIIPQSVFTRHGLYLGAKMATPTKFLIYALGVIAWPVAKLLEFALGPHHGIIYRRAELKELIAMHSNMSSHGGDLKTDTVTIIGATLDLQEKVVKQAMTPIDSVFMLSIESKLDYELLRKICMTGHSRVPVYEEVEVNVGVGDKMGKGTGMQKVKKIVGILLVKQCVLLDPKDAVPLRTITLNKVPFVPNNEPLLGILDKFQEGRSHMAIVSRFSVAKAASVKKAVKRGLTQRLRLRVGMGDSSSSSSSSGGSGDEEEGEGENEGRGGKGEDKDKDKDGDGGSASANADGETLKGDGNGYEVVEVDADLGEGKDGSKNVKDKDKKVTFRGRGRGRRRTKRRAGRGGVGDLEAGVVDEDMAGEAEKNDGGGHGGDVSVGGGGGTGRPHPSRGSSFVGSLPRATMGMGMGIGMTALEQSMPADAVLAKEGAEEFLQSFDPAVMPLGIITLEDVLEELIGEEIYDEFDPEGAHGNMSSYVNVPAPQQQDNHVHGHGQAQHHHQHTTATTKPKDEREPAAGGGGGGAVVPHVEEPAPVSLGTIPVLRPIAMRGLNFLRSRSAPPVPRDVGAVNAEGGDGGAGERQRLAPSTPPRVTSPSITPILSATAEDDKGDKHLTPAGHISPAPAVSSPSEGQEVHVPESKSKSTPVLLEPPPIISRSTSPAPPLEAILLERKRRMNLTVPSSSTPALPVPAGLELRRTGTPSFKGKFKSSPLGGLDRAGVAVAEKVKEAGGKVGGGGDVKTTTMNVTDGGEVMGEVKGGSEEGRIPDGKDKEGPDKH